MVIVIIIVITTAGKPISPLVGASLGRRSRAPVAPVRYANTNLHSRAAMTPVSADNSSNKIWIMVLLLEMR
jgi:hypothetical protein